MKVILDVPLGSLVTASSVASYALHHEKPSDGLMVVSKGTESYSVFWNKKSISVRKIP